MGGGEMGEANRRDNTDGWSMIADTTYAGS